MREMKPTRGPWELWGDANPSQVISSPAGFVAQTLGSNDEANASLIAEAGTVHHNTGLSPVQLVEQRDVMAQALRKIIEMNQQSASDQWGDVNKAESMACVREARAALAKCEGVK